MKILFSLILCMIIHSCWAESKTILTISGKIENKDKNGNAVFDIAGLENIGLDSIETTSPWYDGKNSFVGVPLNKLMREVGAKGKEAKIFALNEYSITIPVSDFDKYHVILALKVNGQYIRIRDKGPLFIIYPYDSDLKLKNQIYYARSAWQVYKIVIN